LQTGLVGDPLESVGQVAVKIDRVDPPKLIHRTKSLVFVEGRCLEQLRGEIDVALGDTVVRASRIGGRFEAMLTADLGLAPGTHRVRATLRAARADYVDERYVAVGAADHPLKFPTPPAQGQEPLVGICLATYEPRADLFLRQVESIREQRHQAFVCVVADDGSSRDVWDRIQEIVADDARFLCSRAPSRLGFYRNFERCLGLIPRDADFIAFADQDDFWHREKLSTLVDAITKTAAALVFSDMRLVDDSGQLLSSTFWAHAQNNTTRLDDLLLTNTVTGASSLFRRELVDVALPFPPDVAGSYHDHWIACVALATDGISYVDAPLYDYVQHSSNASGRVVLSGRYEGGLGRILRRALLSPWLTTRRGFSHASTTYRNDALRLELFARTLENRMGDRLRPRDAKVVRRAARVLESPEAFFWLLGRSLRDIHGRGVTLGTENNLLKTILWRRAHAGLRRVRLRRPV
jgi:glycosyltransferase involved in cell wall biosynthesis